MLGSSPRTSGPPGRGTHLIIVRNVLDPSAVKLLPQQRAGRAAASQLLLVASSRWNVERCFEDEKTELGLDDFEGLGLKCNQAVTAVSHLFLARTHQVLVRQGLGCTATLVPLGSSKPPKTTKNSDSGVHASSQSAVSHSIERLNREVGAWRDRLAL